MKILKGKYVTLKPITTEDAEFVVALRNSDSARFINKGPHTIEEQKKWINNRPSNEYNFIIYFQEKQVGQMSLYNISKEHKTADAGRLLLDNMIPKGFPITFESILLIHIFAFYELNINKISGVVAAGNIGVVKLNDFVRMKREGVLRNQFIFDEICQDGIIFGVLKEEFIKVQEPFLKKMINLTRSK